MSAAVTVGRAELAAAVATVSMGLPKRPVVPVLGGMLVTVSAGSLELAVFDYETSIRLVVAAGTDGAGTVLVPGKELAAAVKALPRTRGAQAVLTVTGDGLVIGCDGTETMLSALPRGEYPQLPEMPEHAGDVDAEAFAAAVGRVAACAGRDDTLPMLLCVHVTSDGGSLNLEATDRYRAGFEPVSWTGSDGLDVLLRAVQLTGFAKRMRKDGKVSLYFGGELAGFTDGALTVITHVTTTQFGGKFPDIGKFIRDSDPTVVTADAKALRTAAEAASTFVEPNGRLGFAVTGGRITLTAVRDGKPASTRSVPVRVDGPDVEAVFCPAYLVSLLAGIKGDAQIGIADGTSKKPAMIRAGAFTGLIMPIRRQDES